MKLQSIVSLADSLETVPVLHSSLLYKWKQDYVSFVEHGTSDIYIDKLQKNS